MKQRKASCYILDEIWSLGPMLTTQAQGQVQSAKRRAEGEYRSAGVFIIKYFPSQSHHSYD